MVYYGTLFASRNCSLLLSVTLWFTGWRMWFCKLRLCYNTSAGATAWTSMSGDLQARVTVIGQASTWPCFQLSALLLFLYAENKGGHSLSCYWWKKDDFVIIIFFFLDILLHLIFVMQQLFWKKKVIFWIIFSNFFLDSKTSLLICAESGSVAWSQRLIRV